MPSESISADANRSFEPDVCTTAAHYADNGAPNEGLPACVELTTGFAPSFRPLISTPGPRAATDRTVFAELGDRIGNFEIIAELGRGGMGIVYQARQCSIGRLVALKMILAGAEAGHASRARFRTEAEAAARLQHPNIVQIHEVGEHGGRPFLALEYVAGGNLARRINGTPMPQQEAARLVETVARAVHYTHEHGILHRDLNPNNVLLTPDGTPKISDFGLAKLVDETGPTRTEIVMGTPNYMSPEQAAGKSTAIGVPTDVYSLGAILYELLTGTPPFRGISAMDTLERVRVQEPVSPRRIDRLISRDLETICLKCLQKEPGKRYPSAEALADDLRRFLDGELIEARPVSMWRRVWKSLRRRPALVARILATAALLCVAITCTWYFRVADQLARHRAEAKYQKFVQCRDEAILYGLLAPDQGALFLGAEANANLQTAQSAAHEALALAGLDPDSGASVVDWSFAAARRSETVADCYTLLLILASVQSQRPVSGSADQERLREPLRLLEAARKLGFQTQAYHLRRAYFLEQMGRVQEANQERERAQSLSSTGALDHFLTGEERYRRGDWEGAKTSFDRALALEPSHFWAQFFLAICQLKTQQWEAAKACLNACLTRQPDFVWAFLFRSFANEKLHSLADAQADFQKALELNPNKDARYVLFLTRGILHFDQGELNRAATDFRSAIDLKPDQYNAYLNLAHAYLVQGKVQEAEELVRRATRLQPPVEALVGYHVERGRCLLRDERYEDAIQACDAALKLSSNQPLPLGLRARAQLAMELYEQAESSFDQYLLNGGEAQAEVFRGRGSARMKLGKYPDAVEDYTRALEREPDADIYQHRGWAHFFSDAWKLALRDFEKAIELDADAGDAYTGRGLARVMLGDFQDAVSDAEAALGRNPDTPEMMHNIACIFAQSVARAGADSTQNRQSLVADYRKRALEAIKQTLNILPPDERPSFWREKILPDEALAPIRDDARFQMLQPPGIRDQESRATTSDTNDSPHFSDF